LLPETIPFPLLASSGQATTQGGLLTLYFCMPASKISVVTIEITGANVQQHEADVISYLRQDSRLSVGSETLDAAGLSPQAGEVYVQLNAAAELESSKTLVSIVVERVTKYLDRPEAESCKPEMLRIFGPDGSLAKSFNQSGK